MSTTVRDDQFQARPREQAALNDLVARLTKQFPEVPPSEIIRAVHGRYAEFDDPLRHRGQGPRTRRSDRP